MGKRSEPDDPDAGGPPGGGTAVARRPRRDPRRELTPQKLVAAARVVFERDGFHRARLADITREANVAIGTLYNYFPSKEALFRAVMRGVLDDLTRGTGGERDEQPASDATARPAGHGDPVQGIIDANRAYIGGYRKNARLMSLLTEVADVDQEVRAIGLAVRQHFETRISQAIARWQAAGLVYSDLDPVYTANALAYMVDRFLHEWVALDLTYDEDLVAETLNKLWLRALGLADGPKHPHQPTS